MGARGRGTDGGHSIRIAARLAGLAADTVRAWERRYGAVRPRRERGRRAYSDGDVTRLTLLREATERGRSIGQIATLPERELERLIAKDRAAREDAAEPRRPGEPAPAPPRPHAAPGAALAREALSAVRDLDAATLEQTLVRATLALGQLRAIEEVVSPLARAVGAARTRSELRAVHESMATAALRSFVGALASPEAPVGDAPLLVITTPPGRPLEIGALGASLAGGSAGWRTLYLGPGLPADEVAVAVRTRAAGAVLVAIDGAGDEVALASGLRRLRRLLPPGLPLLVVGAEPATLDGVLGDVAARAPAGLADLVAVLAGLRA